MREIHRIQMHFHRVTARESSEDFRVQEFVNAESLTPIVGRR